jgi:hypothetical protein
MDFLPLITIPAIFLFVVLVKPIVNKWIGWNICAVCVAVFLTWALLLALLWTDIINNTTHIAILMGMSVTGLMHKLEVYYTSRHLHHLWIARLVVVLGGFTTIILILRENWQGVFLSVMPSLLLLVIVTFLLQGTTHRDAMESAGDGVKKSLLKRLDNCC